MINDIHFGIKDSKRLFTELEQFIDFIQSKDDLNCIIINGDYFDTKLSVGDPATFYAVTFFSKLVNISKNKNLALRIIQGTKSHDLNQLQLFKHYEEDVNLDFQIIENVLEDTLCGLNVLYIPEEYPENSEEYYSQYYAEEKEYSIIFAHTTFDFVAQPSQIENAKKNVHSAPVMFWKDWKHTIPHGFISAGHIHGRNVYGNKIFYSGSFSRWSYGERSAKGFTYFETDGNDYKVEFIDNKLAPRYDVISVNELEIDLETTELPIIQEMLDSRLSDSEDDHLRIDLSGLSKERIEILKKYYSNKPNIKIEVREDKKSLLKESANKKEIFEKYHYITKRELPLNETIKKYCKEDLKTNLTLETINEILKKD